ncbi:MAG: cell division protein FtsQ/DivIB [Pseudomonadota bacterium]|nr:cell division protein FtsQ/DivIB [Pseudomonadota bacterium]
MNAMLRLVAWMLAVALVALPVVAVLNGWIGRDHWPLTKLRITGQFERVDERGIQRALVPHARRGFFAVRLDDARAAIAGLPWIEQAEVRKRWPDVLEVRITEHRPFARWGSDRLLSDHGRLFPANNVEVPEGLPQMSGPDEAVGEVVAVFNESTALFAALGIDVLAIELDPRGSWTLQLRELRSGARVDVLVGRSEARARLARFVRLMPQLLSQDAQRLTRADLRYTNGFALTWQAAEAGTGSGERGTPAASPPDSSPAPDTAASASPDGPLVSPTVGFQRSPFPIPHSRFFLPAIT